MKDKIFKEGLKLRREVLGEEYVDKAMAKFNKIGFVGLGNMGRPMAARLVKAGFQLTVYDSNSKAQKSFLEEYDCTPASSLGDVAVDREMLITMLSNGRHVRQAVLGDEGGGCLLSSMPQGSVLVDMSSSSPVDTQKLAHELASHGIVILDAPVSRGVSGAVA